MSENQQNNNGQQQDLAKQFFEANQKKPIRIDYTTGSAVINDKSWKIKESGVTLETKRKLDKIEAEYNETIKKVDMQELPEINRSQAHEKSTREILETTLEGFDFEQVANDPTIGYAPLAQLAQLVYGFLAVDGGMTGIKQLQAQLSIRNMQNGS